MKNKKTERDEKIILARKIKRLIEEGVDGEANAAAAALERFLKSTGLTMDDIAEIPMQEYGIATTKDNYKFARQVIASVIGQPKLRGRSFRGRTIYFKSTYSEWVEIKDRINHFWDSYQAELKVFYDAFVQKNKLYANPDLDDEKEDKKTMTREEKARLMRMMQMMEGIETDTYYKKLTNK